MFHIVYIKKKKMYLFSYLYMFVAEFFFTEPYQDS